MSMSKKIDLGYQSFRNENEIEESLSSSFRIAKERAAMQQQEEEKYMESQIEEEELELSYSQTTISKMSNISNIKQLKPTLFKDAPIRTQSA